ncbi:hypothetical protein LTR10_003515 [Elasticomyces elasticus]|nr:hypothetical protein LTR10_003515 [Elasticomyces elasticus]KAK4969783.1 hypothetical protein LTR42_009055 [Elasticomyces elasticus]
MPDWPSCNLVWSGACLFKNKNVADFRPSQDANGSFQLSGIELGLDVNTVSIPYGSGKTRGQGHLLNSAYEKQESIEAPSNMDSFNMHELKVVDGGESALHLLWKPEYIDVSELGLEQQAGWVGNMGFREVDIASGKTITEWWSLDHIPLSESSWPVEGLAGPSPIAWDYLHATSVDKGPDGNYLLSSRHTNCVYKIASHDSSVMWRLGGFNSSFDLRGMAFARQHDAHFLLASDIHRKAERGVEYVSLFDNSGDEHNDEASPSSMLLLQLNTNNMEATMVRRDIRPDGGVTRIGGNGQVLRNGNTFVNWAANSLISEHDSAGRTVLEGGFVSLRFSNYRTYKADWQAWPSMEELALKCVARGTSALKSTTVCHVSWNGATEVRRWQFHQGEDETFALAMDVGRDGFETSGQWSGFSPEVFVEAVDSEGLVLGTTSQEVEVPRHWPSR